MHLDLLLDGLLRNSGTAQVYGGDHRDPGLLEEIGDAGSLSAGLEGTAPRNSPEALILHVQAFPLVGDAFLSNSIQGSTVFSIRIEKILPRTPVNAGGMRAKYIIGSKCITRCIHPEIVFSSQRLANVQAVGPLCQEEPKSPLE